MIDVLTTGGTVSCAGGLVWWLRQDGPIRLYAGIMAVRHKSSTVRRDARKVLHCTGSRRRYRTDPDASADGTDE